MGYLTLTRREREDIRLTIDLGVDTERLLAELRDGITIHIGEFDGRQVAVSIEAPKSMAIMRSELT